MNYSTTKQQLSAVGLFLTLTFFSSCTYDTIPEPNVCIDSPVIVVEETTDTQCGTNMCSIILSVSGGIEPYTFALQDGTTNNTGIFESLSAGTYTVVVIDDKGCSSEVSADIQNIDGVNISITTENTECGSNEGQIAVTATGGVEPYSFALSNSATNDNGSFTGLSSGEYTVVVNDAEGCEISQNVLIESGVVFAQVRTIITTNCAVSKCHDGSISPDLRNDQTVQDRASRIQSRTGGRSMPPRSSGRSLSDTEIQEIACWVEDGANL